MSSRRLLKAAEAIREVVSMAILTELRDPRIANVTVTHVEMAADMRTAKVHVSVMGRIPPSSFACTGWKVAAGFLQSKVGKRIDSRYTPRLQFVLDMGVKRSIEISRILRGVLPTEETPPPESEPADDAAAENETHNVGAAHAENEPEN